MKHIFLSAKKIGSLKKSALVLAAAVLFFSCQTAPKEIAGKAKKQKPAKSQYPLQVSLVFAGDIMAHANNFRTGNFDNIWKDVASLVGETDFAFANIEAPVADSLGWDTYPEFNMKSVYPQAAIDAGFNVFSLANNHTNDKRAAGIEETLAWSAEVEKKSQGQKRKIYFSGIHAKEAEQNAANFFDYKIIEKGEWRILFVAVTEILNRYAETEYMNFLKMTDTARNTFAEKIAALKRENGCNFCVVSIHCNEPEYVRQVPKRRQEFYHKLTDSGANVVWANHPHVVLQRELIYENSQTAAKNLIMYANGNTISGQRRSPNYDNPADDWEWTGDGVLIFATFEIERENAEPRIVEVKPVFITSYINTENQIIIKKLDDNLIEDLHKEKRTAWANYLAARKKLIENTKELKTWR